ncbi:MAG: transglutaminase family protein [Thermosynechococcaceae cyanobacterium MS004]|nr:transglutaminase family protein [Thermosynechococcaceae cyanobacterium MS004]
MLTDSQWNAVFRLGQQVDEVLQQQKVGLRMGGEPTFIALDHLHLPEWQIAALGDHKQQVAIAMLRNISDGFFPKGFLLQHGSGKLYPGEPYPRWALSFYWRTDGKALWTRPDLQTQTSPKGSLEAHQALTFLRALADRLDLPPEYVIPAHEEGAKQPVGYVFPLLATQGDQKWYWATCPWLTDQGQYGDQCPITIFSGQSPVGLRLPLRNIEWSNALATEFDIPLNAPSIPSKASPQVLADNTILVAIAAEVRDGMLCVFLPPMISTHSFAELIQALDQTAQQLNLPIHLEGYGPPMNAGIDCFAITPDPGVIEVNVNPVDHWEALVTQTLALDRLAQQAGLSSYKYTLDGRTLGTGGGAHVTIGGNSPQESPLLRRPELLRSIIAYWQHHPSLSYLFSGQFVGPTSQAPRVDEAHHEGLYELELAFGIIDQFPTAPPALIDHLFRPLLTDLTGNTHRAALCIDKLYPVDKSGMQLGLLEFRAFEMPHHPHLRLLQLLLVRAIVAWFWRTPYNKPPIYFETALQDRYFLPYFLQADWQEIMADLQEAGFGFEFEWFASFFETRFPVYGEVKVPLEAGQTLTLELRHALELWPVLPEEATLGGTGRPVDDSLERIQVMLRATSEGDGDGLGDGLDLSRYRVLCQGQRVPLLAVSNLAQPNLAQPSRNQTAQVAGVRFRARQNRGIKHEAIAPQPVLNFEIIDTQTGHTLGGCTYHVNRPDGSAYLGLPKSAQEAAERLKERFISHPVKKLSQKVSQTKSQAKSQTKSQTIPPLQVHPKYPLTLDLRRIVSQR